MRQIKILIWSVPMKYYAQNCETKNKHKSDIQSPVDETENINKRYRLYDR